MFYITGDSHRCLYRDMIDCGDYNTIYKFTKMLNDGLILNENMHEDDYILCVYGEIDVRHHFANQIKNGRDLHEIIDSLVNNYVKSLRNVRAKVVVRGVVAPLPNECHSFDGKNSITSTYEERIQWRRMLNEKLETKCKENNIIFLPSPPITENEDGTMKIEMSDHIIHIKTDQEICDYAFKQLMNVCL